MVRVHSVGHDPARCIGCVACLRACPSQAIRIRAGAPVVKDECCIDCGACVDACRHGAMQPRTATSADLARYRTTVAVPHLTLYAQFGPDVTPGQVLAGLRAIGFDAAVDVSFMCEMVAGATDAYLSECDGPWPKISVTCPAVLRLIQIRYPELLAHLVPIETPRELAAKLQRRRLAAELAVPPEDIGIFFISPCTAIANSIVSPVGQAPSHFDGALSMADIHGPLLKAIKALPPLAEPAISARGLKWAMSGGEVSAMRNQSSLTVRGTADMTHVFDRIEAGEFAEVDYIEAYICPDGCVSGQLAVTGRYAARHTLQRLARRLGEREGVKEEKVRALLAEHFFDMKGEIAARPLRPLGGNLRHLIAVRRERAAILDLLPGKDCGACGAPDCAALVEDILAGEAKFHDCVFVKIEGLTKLLESERGGASE